MVQRIHAGLQASRPAHHRDPLPIARFRLAGARHRVITEIHIARDEEVHFAVAVVIDEAAPGAPWASRGLQTGFLRDVGERTIAVVVIQNRLSPVGHGQIKISVVVVIAHARALSPTRVREAGFGGDVCERAVVIIVVEMRGRRLIWREPGDGRAVGQKNVRPAVVVVIENHGAVAGRLDDEFLVRVSAVDVERRHARARRDVLEIDRIGLHRLRGLLRRSRLRTNASCPGENRDQ